MIKFKFATHTVLYYPVFFTLIGFCRGHNGKIYPYLVVNDSGLSDARREERVLQLLRLDQDCNVPITKRPGPHNVPAHQTP